MLKNAEKSGFFEQNQRFLPLIRYYSKKLKSETAEQDLLEFLYFLCCRKVKPPNDKYIAVCIRNEYIKLSKDIFIFSQFPKEIGDNSTDLDQKIDIKISLTKLTKNEKTVIILHFYYGFSIVEIAESFNISRQRVNKIKNVALKKLRKLVKY